MKAEWDRTDEPRGAMMRKDTCVAGIPVLRLCRMSLTALLVVAAFLLGGAAAAPGAAKTAFTTPSAAKSASTPAVKPGDDSKEEKAKREPERGQPRRTARTSVGVPQHAGRPLPPFSAGAVAPIATTDSGAPAAGSSTKAVSRGAGLTVLHCVFRC
ncbi:hypothetical protein [Streptomyces sp. NPDC015125]|uniref:hypothetical protein n=1 Tax=Streptomyces sp. NPDC015125 TaxID=3364938 RepID=UPI003702FDF3